MFSEVSDQTVQAALAQLAADSDAGDGAISVNEMRAPAVRVHEARHYHDYVAGGGFSLLTYRLMRMRHASALHVLNAVLAATGTVVSLSRLVAESIYPTRLPSELVEHLGLGVDTAAHLTGWNSADQLLSALLGVRMPDDYLAAHWDLFFTFYTDGLLTPASLAPTTIAPTAARTRPPHPLTTEHLLEHLAVDTEHKLLSAHLGPEAASAYCSDRRDFPRSIVARAASDSLGLPCPHPLITAFAEAALLQVPDPELAGGIPVAFSEFAPGDIFMGLLESIDRATARAILETDAARELALAGLDRLAPWHHEIAARAGQLPPAHDLLVERDSLTRLSVRPFEDGRSLAAVLFPLLTIKAGLRGGATDAQSLEDHTSPDWLAPPVVVTPAGLETYPPLTSDPRDFALFVAGCLSHLVIDELSRSATLAGAAEMLNAIQVSHGDLVVQLVGLYLRPLLGEDLHQYVARETPLASTLTQ